MARRSRADPARRQGRPGRESERFAASMEVQQIG
jgi:hypothetical protein